jgi:hypothetical protein
MPNIRSYAASVGVKAPASWPWLNPKIRAAWLAAMVALFLGILSVAAVAEMSKACGREPIYRSTSDGAVRGTGQGGARVVSGKRLECRTAFGGFGVGL